jgi:integrase
MKNPCKPIEKYPEDPYHPYVPSQEDIKKVRFIANRDEKDLIETIYHLAARLSEAVRLTWDDINFEQRWVRLYTRKRRGGELKEDYQPMNLALQKVLKNRWEKEGKSNNLVFQFSPYELRNTMDKLCKKAKIKPFGFHAIRLMYVAITRAKRCLYISFSKYRKGKFNQKSRFLNDIE